MSPASKPCSRASTQRTDAEDSPYSHGTQAVRPKLDVVPAPHTKQELASLVLEAVLGRHGRQNRLPSSEV